MACAPPMLQPLSNLKSAAHAAAFDTHASHVPLSAPTRPAHRNISAASTSTALSAKTGWTSKAPLDTKAVDVLVNREGIRRAGEPIHHMWIRATVNTELVVQSIEAVMDAHPLGGCPAALAGMQKMVGCCMARGWRKSIEANLGSITGCTHMRELLQSMATATFKALWAPSTLTPTPRPATLASAKAGTSPAPAWPNIFRSLWATRPSPRLENFGV